MADKPTKETYSELQQAYDFFNQKLFDDRLPPCLITLQRYNRAFGFFASDQFGNRKTGEVTDEIAMNPSFFAIRPVKKILSTLAHEMVHLDQQHNGEPGRGRYHNKEWSKMMEGIGLMPSSTGEPGGKKVGDKVSHYIIEGGPFDLVCDELITDEFTLSWVDRFPPYIPTALKPKGGEGEDEEEYEREPSEGEDEENLGELSIEIPKGPVNKSNRCKFRCSGCGAQTWGKPSLKVLCGEEGKPCFASPMERVD